MLLPRNTQHYCWSADWGSLFSDTDRLKIEKKQRETVRQKKMEKEMDRQRDREEEDKLSMPDKKEERGNTERARELGIGRKRERTERERWE